MESPHINIRNLTPFDPAGNNGVNKWDYLGMEWDDAESRYQAHLAELARHEAIMVAVNAVYGQPAQWDWTGYGSSLAYDINGDDGYWVQAYDLSHTGFNPVLDHMGRAAFADHRTGHDATFDQATSTLWTAGNGVSFYGSDVVNGSVKASDGTIKNLVANDDGSVTGTGLLEQWTAATNNTDFRGSTSVGSIGGGGTRGATTAHSGLGAERVDQLRTNFAKYLNPFRGYDTPGEAFISGALKAATQLNSTYSEDEYVWGVVKGGDGKFYSTWATTDQNPVSANILNNRWIMQAYYNGTLVLFGHNHPPGRMPGELSGYGRGGLSDYGRGDKPLAESWGRPVVAIDPWGYSHAGDRYSDRITIPGLDDLSGRDFNDMVKIIQGGGH